MDLSQELLILFTVRFRLRQVLLERREIDVLFPKTWEIQISGLHGVFSLYPVLSSLNEFLSLRKHFGFIRAPFTDL